MTLMLLIILAVVIIGLIIYFKTAGKDSVSGPKQVSDAKPVQPPHAQQQGPPSAAPPANNPPAPGSTPDRSNKNNPDSDSALSSGGQG
ncbi:MAG: hypothetical protein LPJ89_02440 [Hymenobacteraceae bacterium]|nr:hypothetical protein [Hymenobacteraceae bacterium]MDX5397580.1 hypothetical protein [Hymenobacteraceae bacterium]MDX5442624.1 hypothetical protein [Hymenobacteraceae bacterium]MDX5513660.1 hypothetical protein [Hymenobacteraceae bacterium]